MIIVAPLPLAPSAIRKPITMIALPILIGSFFFEIYWTWGLLFIYWGAMSIRSGDAYVVEPIERREHPILFWIITALWMGSGAYYLYVDAWRVL